MDVIRNGIREEPVSEKIEGIRFILRLILWVKQWFVPFGFMGGIIALVVIGYECEWSTNTSLTLICDTTTIKNKRSQRWLN